MKSMKPMKPNQLAREKLLFRYSNALERGDFAMVEAILQEAQHDAELERMIAEINMALDQELPKYSTTRKHNNPKDTPMNRELLVNNWEASGPKRFPFALAAAILAVVLIGGLLATAQFGFDHQGDTLGGASSQRESATPIASDTSTPIGLNPIEGTPTIPMTFVPTEPNSINIAATQLPNGSGINYNQEDVLCTGTIGFPTSSTQQNNMSVPLTSRPGNTRLQVAVIQYGTPVDILDQSLFPGGVGVWQQSPGMWYFVSSANPVRSVFEVQGWIQDFFVEFTTECPAITDAEKDYWLSAAMITSVEGGPGTPNVEFSTVEPPTATPLPTLTATATPSVTPSWTPMPITCQTNLLPRLDKGMPGTVVQSPNPSGLEVFSDPHANAPAVLGLIGQGAVFDVTGAAECVDGYYWYPIKVYDPSGTEGYVVETALIDGRLEYVIAPTE